MGRFDRKLCCIGCASAVGPSLGERDCGLSGARPSGGTELDSIVAVDGKSCKLHRIRTLFEVCIGWLALTYVMQ